MADRRHYLIFINGDPRSGKDTVAGMLVREFADGGYVAEARSSIEPVREMLERTGFDLSGKTEKDRYLLAEVGDRTEEHSGFRSNYCVQAVRALIERSNRVREAKGSAMILHTREPHTIHKIVFGLRRVRDIQTETLFVAGRGEPVSSNKADAGVRGMEYDETIHNDSSLTHLYEQCRNFVWRLTLLD